MPNISNLLLLPLTTLALAVAPIGNVALVLALLVVFDLALAVLIARLIGARRKKAENAIVILDGDMPMHLLRRTEPALRAHRPVGIVELQVRWRHAAEAHRRNNEKGWGGR